MENVVILSMIENKGKIINNAPFCKESWHKEDVSQEMLQNGKQWYEHKVKFDGVKPLQLLKTTKLKTHLK